MENDLIERNKHIKKLWGSGEFTQKELGVKFNLTLTRVNNIINNYTAPWRRCRYCGEKDETKTALCIKCREERKKIKSSKLEILANKKLERIEKAKIKIKNNVACQQKTLEEKLQQYKKEKLLRHKTLFGRELDINNLSELFTEKWQANGKERTRFFVRKRDNFTCQSCGLKRTPEEVSKYNREGRKPKMFNLDVHHLNGLCGKLSKKYDSSKDISGLITLCHKCHYNHPEHTNNKSVDK